MAVHSLNPGATDGLCNLHCLKIFFTLKFRFLNPLKTQGLGSSDHALLCGGYRLELSSPCPHWKGPGPEVPSMGLTTPCRLALSLPWSVTAMPVTYRYVALCCHCKVYKSTRGPLSEWLQKSVFLFLSLFRIKAYCWGGWETSHYFTV